VVVQNFILGVKYCTKKSKKNCQGLELLFKSGRVGDMDLKNRRKKIKCL
jgi:hypothetical protein